MTLLERWRIASRQTALPDDVRRDVAEVVAALEEREALKAEVRDLPIVLDGNWLRFGHPDNGPIYRDAITFPRIVAILRENDGRG